jgi:hypothetical protein
MADGPIGQFAVWVKQDSSRLDPLIEEYASVTNATDNNPVSTLRLVLVDCPGSSALRCVP